ncbi:hypothetical protein MNV_20013 [Candidatus Methanoperedens nitroreducens]|uniref:Uncharacterized protein n=1 Tax=Candidatus Methanoperedens nitratireducens TaxID=1392998 RepID=A0A284VN65_9EURY|nr:hypothetical protein MNV_20013 [Candidatus Methanoperedens nitroreducens]
MCIIGFSKTSIIIVELNTGTPLLLVIAPSHYQLFSNSFRKM